MAKTVDIRSLAREDDRRDFSCGHADLDRFFEHYAGQNQFKLHLAVTYVAVVEARIIGFVCGTGYNRRMPASFRTTAHILIVIAVLSSAGCARHPTAADCTDPTRRGSIVGSRAPLSAAGMVSATFLREITKGKPPHLTRFADVQLRNPVVEPRWLLISTELGRSEMAEPDWAPVETLVQAHLLSSSPRVVVFDTTWGAFLAIQLPGHGTVTLRRVAVESFSRNAAEESELDVVIARHVDVDGVPFEAMLTGSALSDSAADVQAPSARYPNPRFSDWQPSRCDVGVAGSAAGLDRVGPLHIVAEYLIRSTVLEYNGRDEPKASSP